MCNDPIGDLRLDEQLFSRSLAPVTTIVARLSLASAGSFVRQLDCRQHGDELHFEGDIIVSPASLKDRALYFSSRTFGHGVGDRKYTWPAGVIPYICDASIKELVAAAAAHWMQRTPLKIVPFRGEDDYVVFELGDHSASNVGRIGGDQSVSLHPGATLGTAIHELGHVIGLWHEHSRSDRDSYITIHRGNFDPANSPEFDQPVHSSSKLLGPYDLMSVMHYPSLAFTTTGEPTITSNSGVPIGGSGISNGDVLAVKALYPTLGR
ncbi:M12 family metallopeptidase [Pseudoxanthomonas sp. LARHCG66]